MGWRARKTSLQVVAPKTPSAVNRGYFRPLRFEPLEDRRMLAAIPGIDDTFIQVARITNAEVTILSADAAGHFKIYYHPNDELGYIDPATGDLLTADYIPGTSSVLVLTAIQSGNLSNLVGVTYSNGQVIATNGGNTVYHYDGSIMRQNNVWTYDAGATFENASGNWFWSNGNQLRTGTTMYHANGAVLRNAAGSLLYAGGATFQDAATSSLFYVGGQTLRNASSDYFYASGTALKTDSTNTIRYSNNVVMVDSTGNVYNSTGTLGFTPFTNTQTIGASEYFTHVDGSQSDTVFSTQNDVSGEFGAYVSTFHTTFQVLPPNPLNIAVAAPDATSLRFTWNSGGGTTAEYRVAITNGPSAPSDPATGTDTANNYYDVTGLTAGQKVSIRVWAKDAGGLLSSGVFATGTAGLLQQASQTGWLIASSLDTTFAQVYDTIDKNVIYTVDQAGNFVVALYVDDDLGYVNIANGDRLIAPLESNAPGYAIPGTDLHAPEVNDFKVLGNIASIRDGAKYPNGTTARSGNTYYYSFGAVLRSADGTWFYSNGSVMQNATGSYWPGNIIMQQGGVSKYPNGATLKSGSTITYQGGNTFYNGTAAQYSNATTLKAPNGNLSYETGSTLFSSGIFRYPSGPTLIDASGQPFYLSGSAAPYPFGNIDILSTSSTYEGIGTDHIADYAVTVQGNTSVHVLGGTVDYSVPPPPAPTGLTVLSTTTNSVTFAFNSGGGSTVDYVLTYNDGTTPPSTSDNGVQITSSPFTINTSTGGTVAVRLAARNSEGELSWGVTAVGTATTATSVGDYNQNNTVDAADYVLWRKTLGSTTNHSADGNANGTVDQPDYDIWRAHFGQTLPTSGSGSGTAVVQAASYSVAAAASSVAGVSDLGALPTTAPQLTEVGRGAFIFTNAFTPATGLTEASYNFANDWIRQPSHVQPDLQLFAAISLSLPEISGEFSGASFTSQPDAKSHADDLSLGTIDDAFAELANLVQL